MLTHVSMQLADAGTVVPTFIDDLTLAVLVRVSHSPVSVAQVNRWIMGGKHFPTWLNFLLSSPIAATALHIKRKSKMAADGQVTKALIG